MRKRILVLLMLAVGALSVQANPTLTGSSDGALAWDAATGAISLEASLATEANWQDVLTAGVMLTASEQGAQTLTATGALSLGDLALSTGTTFDVQSASLVNTTFELSAPLLDAEITLSGVLEPGALGAQIALTATGDSVIRSMSVGFNLDAFGRIQTTSCALPFSCAEARFALPLDGCETTIDARISFDAAGFSELSLSAPHVGDLPFAITFGGFLTFTLDEKTIQLSPSLNLENPDCFDFYVGLDWDAATHTLSELLFYGMGMRCELGAVQFRLLIALDPSVLALVKAPYRSLLGLVWPLSSCCGPAGEGSLAFFFGTDNLFDLGEINAELILPITESLTFSLAIELPMTSTPIFTFGWQVSFI